MRGRYGWAPGGNAASPTKPSAPAAGRLTKRAKAPVARKSPAKKAKLTTPVPSDEDDVEGEDNDDDDDLKSDIEDKHVPVK